MNHKRHHLFLGLFVLTLSCFQLEAAPKAKLWDFWNNSGTQTGINHGRWQEFLDTYVHRDDQQINRVQYEQAAKNASSLTMYINTMKQIPIRSYTKNEQMAYWINLYNALTVNLILDDYPVASIKDISSGLLSFGGPWNMKVIEVEGKKLTLNDIEHRILRPIWKDNRIHYAVNCASVGCPNLSKTAFLSSNLEIQLELGATEYVNHPRGIMVAGTTLKLSSIYDWYQSDFGRNAVAVAQNLLPYTKGEKKAALTKWLAMKGNVIYEYNWNLNE